MERESNPMQPMCRSGCGFYGNPATDGLCSVCYKDSLRKKQQPPVGSTPVSVPSPQPSPTFSPAITIPSAAQPTVQSLQQQHNEIKEIMANNSSQPKASTPTPNSSINNAGEVPSSSNQIDGQLEAAVISSATNRDTSPRRFKSYKKRLAAPVEQNPKTFKRSLTTIKEEVECGKEQSPLPGTSSNKIKRVGFMRQTAANTSTTSGDLKISFQKSNLDPSQAVKAAKILTTPQKGQVPATSISLATIKVKPRNDLRVYNQEKEKSVTDNSSVEIVQLNGKSEIEFGTGKRITTSAIENKQLTEVESVNIRKATDNKVLGLESKVGEGKEIKSKDNSTIEVQNRVLKDNKSSPKSILITQTKSPQCNLVKSGRGSQIVLHRPTNLQTCRNIPISHPFSKHMKSTPVLRPSLAVNRRRKAPISVVRPIPAPEHLVQEFTTNINTYNLHTEETAKDNTYTVTPSQSFLQYQQRVQLRYVKMTGKKGFGKNGNNSSSSSEKGGSKNAKKDQGKDNSSAQKASNKSDAKNDVEKNGNNPSSSQSGGGAKSNDPDKDTNGSHSSSSQKDNNNYSSSQREANKMENNSMSFPKGSKIDKNSTSSSSSATSRKRKINEENTAKTSSEAAASASAGPSTSTDSAEDDKDKEDDKDSKKKKNRCSECRKKVGLTGFLCRCGGLYCAVHRYSDKHNCTFDYREHGAQEIRRNNPVVVGEKIQKI